MTPLAPSSLIVSAGTVGLIGALLNSFLLGSGQFPIMLTPLLGVVSLLMALGLYTAGKKVRDLRDGKPSTLNPIMALRIVLFARASALVCASGIGLCVGIILTGMSRFEGSAVRESLFGALAAGVGFAAWMIAGIVVEKWGQRQDDEPPQATGTA